MDPEKAPFTSEIEDQPPSPGAGSGQAANAVERSLPSYPDSSFDSPLPSPVVPAAQASTPDQRNGVARMLSMRSPASYSMLPDASPATGNLRPVQRSPLMGSPAPGIQTHLCRVTTDLVDILDQVSTKGNTPPSSMKDYSGKPSLYANSRNESRQDMLDLEGQAGSSPLPDATLNGEEMVPAHHVRRLTTSVVDMLRSLAGTGAATMPRAASAGGPDRKFSSALPDVEGAALLWENQSDLGGGEFDHLSVGSGSTARDSEISAAAALLKQQYMPQPEYRGDDVHPFYVDRVSVSRSPASAPIFGDKPDLDADLSAEVDDSYPVPRHIKKRMKTNWYGLFVFVLFCIAFVTYVILRSMYTLPLGGSLWYGIVVLTSEIIGGLAMIPYGLTLVKSTVYTSPYSEEEGAKPPPAAVDYHIRVVIPCYKEPLEVVSKTFMAAMYAALPPNCRRTVYLCDDGKSPDKRKFIRSLGMPNAVYVAGRKRAKGEMNGKSANINNICRLLYPAEVDIPLDEILCVFDADQVPNGDFFLKTIYRLDLGQNLAMVLSPQTFYNMNPDGDIFNHTNVQFWEYMQVGYDALGLISCTGTNFLLRAKAFKDAGWFPEYTLTEDFALGIELKRRGWCCSYVNEYLAVGEAPEEVRNCFQQRSRWAKGHFQVFASRKHNPCFGKGAEGLGLGMRLMYGNVFLSYVSTFIGLPIFMLVPMITIWFGSFPIIINFWAAVSVTIYGGSLSLMFYYTRSFGHLKSMWFASVSNAILWWAFLKALYRSTLGRLLSGTIVFKVTAKGLQKLNNLPLRDVWVSFCWFIFCLVSLTFGLVHFFRANVMESPLAISLVFMVYNLIPQYLLLQYAVYRSRIFYNTVCKLCMFISSAMLIMGMVLVWMLYPKSYNYKQALGYSLYFMDTQRVGALSPDYRVPWRMTSFEADQTAKIYLAVNPNITAPEEPAPTRGVRVPIATGLGGLGGGVGVGTAAVGAGARPAVTTGRAGRRLLQKAPTGKTPSGKTTTPAAGALPATTSDGPTGTLPAAGAGAAAAATLPRAGLLGGGAAAGAGTGLLGGGLGLGLGVRGPPPPRPPPPQAPSFATILPDEFPPELTAKLAANGTVDLSGGWVTGMAGGNIKATYPIAFTTAVLAWSELAFPSAFKEAGQTANLRDSVRWGADYLSKVHQVVPERNASYLITRMGDAIDDPLLWYRPEDGPARPAYAVDLNDKSLAGGPPAGGDLAGSVAAALAASSALFGSSTEPGDAEYAAGLLKKALEVYDAAYGATRLYTDVDYNMGYLYNSTTLYDDMAWAAAWMYKATGDEKYLTDLYEYYVKHIQLEGEISDYKYAFDWDNVFWPVNVLMAQETGEGTFKEKSEDFLKSWMCANNAANYTERGRAFNPMSNTLGNTASAAMLALVYSDVAEKENAAQAETYRCWALSQLRYMLGDAGRSMVVGFGTEPPTHTQDRGAACPLAPQVCNSVTGFMSPHPDPEVLLGALVQGPGKSDNLLNERTNDASRVGIESNAGFVGALAGAALLPERTWDTCLQSFGIYRSNPVCGNFVAM